MVCFLTSRPDDPDTGGLNPANRFPDELRRHFPEHCRALYVCSDPETWEGTDHYAAAIRTCFEKAGFPFERFDTLDGRNEDRAAELVSSSDLIVLAGGHVPTQNRFFRKIGLRETLRAFPGVIIGISAGSMNCAETVYAQPEEAGEAIDPAYERFLPGLGLTETTLLPHYQMVKGDILDGLRVFEDIAYPDSMGRTFYAIPDGSYLLIGPGGEELRGEAYELRDGRIRRITGEGEAFTLA